MFHHGLKWSKFGFLRTSFILSFTEDTVSRLFKDYYRWVCTYKMKSLQFQFYFPFYLHSNSFEKLIQIPVFRHNWIVNECIVIVLCLLINKMNNFNWVNFSSYTFHCYNYMMSFKGAVDIPLLSCWVWSFLSGSFLITWRISKSKFDM